MSNISKSLEWIHERMEKAAARANRQSREIRLVAVSKTVDIDCVAEALACGQTIFGENRVPELARKAERLPEVQNWHLIGHLQKNKVRTALQYASCIHSVDSIALIERLERIAGEENVAPDILLQVNISGEASKSGFTPEEANAALETLQTCTNINCRGFMTMAPFGADEGTLRACFGGLRELRDQLETAYSVRLPELSMGMSGDFETAIEEGATLIRVGTAIFGARQ